MHAESRRFDKNNLYYAYAEQRKIQALVSKIYASKLMEIHDVDNNNRTHRGGIHINKKTREAARVRKTEINHTHARRQSRGGAGEWERADDEEVIIKIFYRLINSGKSRKCK